MTIPTVPTDSAPNSYLPPLGYFVYGGLGVPASHGWLWIKRSWTLFAAQPLIWWWFLFVAFVASFVAQLVPIIGSVVSQAVSYYLVAVFCYSACTLMAGQKVAPKDFLKAFRRDTLPDMILLMVLGFAALLFVVMALIGLLFLELPADWMQIDREKVLMMVFSSVVLILGGALALALIVFITYLTFYAVPLVVINRIGAIAALGRILRVMAGNIPAFFINGVLNVLLFSTVIISLGLSLLVLMPLMWLQIFVSYHDLFYRKSPATNTTNPSPSHTSERSIDEMSQRQN